MAIKYISILLFISLLFIGQASAETKTITLGHEPQYTWDGVQITELSNISEIPGGYSINWRGMIYNISILNGYDTFAYPNGTFVSANIFPHINRWQTPQKKWVEIIPSSRTISRNGNDIYLNMTMFEGGQFNITYTITDRIKYTWDFTSGTDYNYSIDFQIHGAAGMDVNPDTKKYTPTWFNNFPIYDWTDIQEPYASNVTTSIDVNNKIMYQRIVLGQMPIGSRIIIDPTIQLQAAETENLGDAYVYVSAPDTNYGSLAYFYIQEDTLYQRRAYIKFNLSSIPAEATIDNAVLFMNQYRYAVTTTTASVYHQFNGSWVESTLTWNNQPYPTGMNLTAESTNNTLNSLGWNSWSVTNMVANSTSNGKTNISMVIKTSELVDTTGAQFCSKEYTTDTTLRPYLNITYTEAPSGTTPNITSWGNNYTNNNTLSFTIPQNTNVTFNATANQTLTTCSWVGATQINCSADTFAYKLFDELGTKYVNLSGSNTNGTTLNSINWTILVEIEPTPTPTPTQSEIQTDFDNFTTMQLSIFNIVLTAFMQPPLLFISYFIIFVSMIMLVAKLMRGNKI